jgi:hypothetical protein
VWPEGQESWVGMNPAWSWGLVQPMGWGSLWGGNAAVSHRPGAWQGQRCGEPSGAEQLLCRPMKQGLGGLAVLLVDHGMEKPFTILGFRMPLFQLSLVLYLRQVCLQCLGKIPGSCSSHGLWLCPSHCFGSL